MYRARVAIFVLAIVVAVAGCAPRGTLQAAPDDALPSVTREIFVATNRASSDGPTRRGRSEKTAYLNYAVRIPSEHQPGNLRLAAGRPDPRRDFLYTERFAYGRSQMFYEAVRRRLNALPKNDREIILYVHGFNITFSEGVAQWAQMQHDLDLSGVGVHFSWPSAASPLGYAYDRESVLFSRDSFEAVLRQLAKVSSGRVIVVAHSAGSQLTMETLRQIELGSAGWSQRNLRGVVLISPDIDVDVFRQQASRIGRLPRPFVVFTSERDRVLGLSARVTGERNRLGTVTDPTRLADLEITLINITDFSEGAGHFTVARSPALLQILGQMTDLDESFHGDRSGRVGLVPGTVLTVRNVTEIILSPLTPN